MKTSVIKAYLDTGRFTKERAMTNFFNEILVKCWRFKSIYYFEMFYSLFENHFIIKYQMIKIIIYL